MNVILIGYRGSGKTTLGRLLAQRLHKTFLDVDDECCRRFGNDSIADIWRVHGEPKWRQVEVQVTRELVGRPDMVIGLGGGTLMQPGARQAVEQAQALRIYLYCRPEVLLQRVTGDARSSATRPNLTRLGGGLEEIKTILAQRDPVYRAVADKIVDVSNLEPDAGVEHLVRYCL